MSPRAREFRREAEGSLVASVDRRERDVLAEVVEGVVDLLASRAADLDAGRPAGVAGAGEPDGGPDPEDWPPIDRPADPALLRLLPDAAREAGLADELRRLTEADLRETKATQVGLLHAALAAPSPEVVVAGRDARAVAAAFTDVRLVLGERLGLRDDGDAERLYALAVAGGDDVADDEETTARFLAAVYVVLSELQESLVERLLEDLPPLRGGKGR